METLRIVFQFLEAKTSREILSAIEVETSFERMKSVSKYKGFFRKGTSGQESKLVSPRTKEKVMEKHGEMMAEFGYSI
jgi:hypothetical protein